MSRERFLFPSPIWALSASLFLLSTATIRPMSARGEDQTPEAIVRAASWNDLHAAGPQHPFRYRLRKVDQKGSTVKEIVETKDGDVARLMERDDRPLSPEQEQNELNRLENLLNHPELQAHRRQKEQEDSARGDEMVKMLPDAFLYTAAGTVAGPSGPCYRFTFKPNPNFTPPDREGEVYHGMVGELWVDKEQLRLAKIDAHLVSDVNFGWGVLGKLYKGGSIVVENADVGMHHWETVHMRLNLHGKILMMKSVDFSTTEDSSAFQPVPVGMSYQDAIRMLQKDSGNTGTPSAQGAGR